MPAGASYHVSWSREARHALQTFAETKPNPVIGAEVARAVQLLDNRLRTDPLLVGEVYRSRGAIQEHLGVQGLVAIDFAVDTARKLVRVRHCLVGSREGG